MVKKLLTGKGGKVVDEKRWKSCCQEKVEKLKEFQKGVKIKIRKINSIMNPKIMGSFII